MTRNSALWKKVDVKFSPFHESQNTVVKCFVNLLPPNVTCIRLDFKNSRNWIKRLNFEEISVRLQDRCPHLKTLILKDAVVSENLPLIIDLCTQFLQDVKILIFFRSRFLRPPKREFGVDSKIEASHLYDCHTKNLNKPPFLRMLNLKQLHLSRTDVVKGSWFEDEISLLNQLNVLDVGYTCVSNRTFQTIQSHGLNVKELYLYGRYLACEGVLSLNRSCQSLQNVYVMQEVVVSYVAHPFIVANKDKLEIVKVIYTCNYHQWLDYLCE